MKQVEGRSGAFVFAEGQFFRDGLALTLTAQPFPVVDLPAHNSNDRGIR